MIIATILLILACVIVGLKYKQGYAWSDLISPKRWKAVTIWLLKRFLRWWDGSDVYLTKNELIQYSFRVAKCTPCLVAGKCINCGCDAEGRMNGRFDDCSAGEWGAFLSEDEMNEFLASNNIEFNFKTTEK